MSQILGEILPQDIVNLLNQGITNVVVSTINDKGYPHAIPIGLITPRDSKTILMSFMKGHQSAANIKNNSKAFITVCDGPDLAVGIRGTARVIKEPMDGNQGMSMIEFKVEEVKSDTTPAASVEQGIRIKFRTERGENFYRIIMDELKNQK